MNFIIRHFGIISQFSDILVCVKFNSQKIKHSVSSVLEFSILFGNFWAKSFVLYHEQYDLYAFYSTESLTYHLLQNKF